MSDRETLDRMMIQSIARVEAKIDDLSKDVARLRMHSAIWGVVSGMLGGGAMRQDVIARLAQLPPAALQAIKLWLA